MSAISGVGDGSLYQVLQQVSGGSQASTTSAATGGTTASAVSDPTQETTGTHHHHGHHGFAGKIESTVTTALQNAPAGSDPNQVVKDAIAQALQQGKAGGAHGHDGDGDKEGGGAGGAGGAAGTSSASANATSSSDTAFSQLLASYGVSPQDFQQDLQGAVSADGSVNFSTLLGSFPPGSLLQATG